MSQDPLRSMKRAIARSRTPFPEPLYQEFALAPLEARALAAFGEAARDVWLAHLVVLAEERVIEPSAALDAARVLSQPISAERADSDLRHPLRVVETIALASAGGALRLGTAREEIDGGSSRMAVRSELLHLHDQVVALRETLADLAIQHLNTLIVITSNGQSVQPTTLAHYLMARIAPLTRMCQRFRQSFERVNMSPIGAVAGAASSVPMRRERSAALLGFDGVIENTLDAVASTDWISEVAHDAGYLGTWTANLVTDVGAWAKDDVGTLVPSEGFVHVGTGQPQRVDPGILDYLSVRSAKLELIPSAVVALLGGRDMLGGVAARLEAPLQLLDGLTHASETVRLAAAFAGTADVNRAMFANRTNRGFSTSSELAELLAIDLQLPVDDANAIAERVVAEALLAGQDAMDLRTDLVDRIALQMIGRELGIEPELLSRCLAPKRFIERRDVYGGPAPRAVMESLEREHTSIRQDRDWSRQRSERLVAARAQLLERVAALAGVSADSPQ